MSRFILIKTEYGEKLELLSNFMGYSASYNKQEGRPQIKLQFTHCRYVIQWHKDNKSFLEKLAEFKSNLSSNIVRPIMVLNAEDAIKVVEYV